MRLLRLFARQSTWASQAGGTGSPAAGSREDLTWGCSGAAQGALAPAPPAASCSSPHRSAEALDVNSRTRATRRGKRPSQGTAVGQLHLLVSAPRGGPVAWRPSLAPRGVGSLQEFPQRNPEAGEGWFKVTFDSSRRLFGFCFGRLGPRGPQLLRLGFTSSDQRSRGTPTTAVLALILPLPGPPTSTRILVYTASPTPRPSGSWSALLAVGRGGGVWGALSPAPLGAGVGSGRLFYTVGAELIVPRQPGTRGEALTL